MAGIASARSIRPSRTLSVSRVTRTIGAITLAALAVGIGLVVSFFGALTSLGIAIFRRCGGSGSATSFALRKSSRRRLRRSRQKVVTSEAAVEAEAASA